METESSGEAGPAEPDRKLPKVLIIDDEAHVRSSLSRLFRRHGLDVSQTTDARKALGWLRNGKRPDCIVLDLMMPEMSGKAFLKEVEAQGIFPLNRIVVLTAVHNADNATAYMQLGVAGYCGKPWDNARIMAQVNRALGRPARTEDLDSLV